jgi:hypothetical protein
MVEHKDFGSSSDIETRSKKPDLAQAQAIAAAKQAQQQANESGQHKQNDSKQ